MIDFPVSSDGMIMRTSYKVRFEVEKSKYFEKEKQEKLNDKIEKKLDQASKRLLTLSEVKAKRFLLRQMEKINSKQSFIELPIHIMHQDLSEGEFVQPLDREVKPYGNSMRKTTLTKE